MYLLLVPAAGTAGAVLSRRGGRHRLDAAVPCNHPVDPRADTPLHGSGRAAVGSRCDDRGASARPPGTVGAMDRLLASGPARRLLLTGPLLALRARLAARHEPELDVVRALLPRGGMLVDVGANTGTYVVAGLAAGALVLAVEPQPELAAQLRFWFPTASVTVVETAVAPVSGTAALHQPLQHEQVLHARASLRHDANDGYAQRTITVRTDTLDALVAAHGHDRVDVVKIDVEGFECDVLRSAGAVLDTYRPAVVVEVERRHHHDHDPWEAFAILHGHGYDGFFLAADGSGLRPLDEFDPDRDQPAGMAKDPASRERPAGLVNNFVFVHPERGTHRRLHLPR